MKYLLPLFVACSSVGTSPAALMDPGVAWTRHTILAADTIWKGADGVELFDVDLDGDLDVLTPWEQGQRVSIALADPAGWTVVSLTGLGAVEAATAGDVNDDGCPDVVSASESRHLWVHLQDCPDGRPDPLGPWVTSDIGLDVQRWMQAAVVDGIIYAGGKHVAGYPGTLDSYELVNGTWVRTTIGSVGWTMSLLVRDIDRDGDGDLLVSDRKGAGLASSQKGTWWWERTASGWTGHHLAQIPGDSGFLAPVEIGGLVVAVVDGNRTDTWLRQLDGTADPLPWPVGVGDYHSSAVGDLNADGYLDLVLTYALTDASGVVALLGPDFRRQEISGVAGHKFDNAVLADVDGDGDTDVVTSEGGDVDKSDDLGVVWYENPGPL